MEKWEYRSLKFETKGWFWGGKLDTDDFDQGLNTLGMDGWELVSCFDTNQDNGASRYVIAVLKRKV